MKLADDHLILTATSYVREICKPLKQLCINHFAFTRSYKNGVRIYLCTSSEWIDKYFSNNFYKLGVCVHSPIEYRKQMLLWTSLPHDTMYQAGRDAGLKEGIFISNPQKDYTDFFDFSSNHADVNIVNVYMNNREILEIFTEYFLEEAKYLIEDAKSDKFVLPHRKDELAFGSHANFMNYEKSDMPKLTKRQFDCMKYFVEGKSYKQIGQILQLSPRTIETYIHNLKIKYKVQNSTQLILTVGSFINEQAEKEKKLQKFLNHRR